MNKKISRKELAYNFILLAIENNRLREEVKRYEDGWLAAEGIRSDLEHNIELLSAELSNSKNETEHLRQQIDTIHSNFITHVSGA